nr:AMP-binding, conserved site-containing protein [Tanacetum cinerariifolium]
MDHMVVLHSKSFYSYHNKLSNEATNFNVKKILKKSKNTRLDHNPTKLANRSFKVQCKSSSQESDPSFNESRQPMEGVVRSVANYVPLSPISFLERAAKVYRDRTSVVYGSIKYTWEETHRRCVKLASSLNRLGVARGDVVAILAPNVPAMIELHFAVPMAGAIICPLNTRLDSNMITTLLGHSETKILFGNPQIDHLGKFDDKADEGFFVGYSLNSKAFRVFNSRTRILEKNLYIRFSENTPNVVGSRPAVNAAGTNEDNKLPFDLNMPTLEDVTIFNFLNNDEGDGIVADINNMDTTIQVSHIPTIRIHKDHPHDQVIGDFHSTTQTRNTSKNLEEHRNKKDERGIMIRNKARLVAQGNIQEEGIDYDKVFTPVARIKAISLFIAYASFKDFVVYQMDVKSVFSMGRLKKRFYVNDIIFGSTKKELSNAFERLMHEKFQMSSMGELTFFLELHVKQKKDGIFVSQDKYVATILKRFGFTKVKNPSTPIETQNPLLKDEDGKAKKSVRLIMQKFWSTPMAKTINGEAHIHSRVDGKKVRITEASIRRDVQLADEEGVDCLPISIIFKQLDLTGVHDDADKEMFDADKDLGGEEVFVEQEVVTDKEKIDEVTLGKALAELKASKPKAKRIVL